MRALARCDADDDARRATRDERTNETNEDERTHDDRTMMNQSKLHSIVAADARTNGTNGRLTKDANDDARMRENRMETRRRRRTGSRATGRDDRAKDDGADDRAGREARVREGFAIRRGGAGVDAAGVR